MGGNIQGKLFTWGTFGESHGPALGVFIDGMLPHVDFSLDELQHYLNRRRPGVIPGTSSRKEADEPEILSGIFEGKTLGTPIAVIIRNQNARSEDYEDWKDKPRTGHGDQTYQIKYGIRDYRGGGRASGRETVSRVIAGYFARKLLPQLRLRTYASRIGEFEIDGFQEGWFDDDDASFWPEKDSKDELLGYLEKLKSAGEVIDGEVTMVIDHCPVGLGEPVFDKLKSDLAKSIVSIGGCTSCAIDMDGIEAGISNGRRIILEARFKEPSTSGDMALQGRHDPCIVPRAVVVVESMVLTVLADHYLRQKVHQD